VGHPQTPVECGRFLKAGSGYHAEVVLDNVKRNHGTVYLMVRGRTHHVRLPASWQLGHSFSVLETDSWHLPGPPSKMWP
jgi:diaminopimelate decarboxylase